MLSRDRIVLLGLIGSAVIFGVIAIYFVGPKNVDFSDSGDYIGAARMLLDSGRYPWHGTLPFFRAPLYPMLLAIVWSIFPGSVVAVKLVQVILHASTVIFVFRGSMAITANRAAAATGGFLVASNPLLLFNAAAIQTETLHTFLVTLALLGVVRAVLTADERLKWSVVAGIAFGFGALCKPSAVGIGVAMSVTMFAIVRSKRAFMASGALIAGMFVVILPWSMYTTAGTGEFFLINDAGGYAMWLGNHPASLKIYEGEFESKTEVQKYQDYLAKTLASEQMSEWEAGDGYERLSLKDRESLWLAKAIENATRFPATTLKLAAWKFWGFWKPLLNADVYGAWAAYGSVAIILPIYFLGAVGFWHVATERRKRAVILLLSAYAIFVTILHVVVVSAIRLRVPYIDPWLMLFAGAGVVIIASRVWGFVTVGRSRE